jgi:hypothetical protein
VTLRNTGPRGLCRQRLCRVRKYGAPVQHRLSERDDYGHGRGDFGSKARNELFTHVTGMEIKGRGPMADQRYVELLKQGRDV